MITTATLIALGKVLLSFCIILFFIYKHRVLWFAILCGAVAIGLLFGLSPLAVASSFFQTTYDARFLSLGVIVVAILLLSSVQEATGQGQRLVAGLTPYLRSPRLRLIFFPALIGLLPMPGGAIFSCPMVRDIARGSNLNEGKQTLINYWFRHIWEIFWPLYPGYILACTLGDIPFSLLWKYTWPIVISNIMVGILFFLRGPIDLPEQRADGGIIRQPLRNVLLEGLPLLVAVLGMPIFSLAFSVAGVASSVEKSFLCSLLSAVAVACTQTRLPLRRLPPLLFSRGTLRMVLLIYAIYAFKDVILNAGVINSLAGVAASPPALLCFFFLLPLVSGFLTGMMAGFVGASFPLLIGLLNQMDLADDRLTWIIFALAAGNLGQMASPLHSCFIVTVEFFHTHLLRIWRRVVIPSLSQFFIACLYIAFLHFILQVKV